MGFLTILIIALGLAMDALAVAIATGVMLPAPTFRQFFRLSFHFGLFQFLMPIIGWLVGTTISSHIQTYDHWVAFGLLAIIGGRMIWGSFSNDSANAVVKDPTRKMSLIMLSTATSIDALAVGLSLAVLKVSILYPCVVIGVVAAIMTILGMLFGSRLGRRFGKRMELIGGLVLIAIGVKILFDHMLV
jgi:manganese efflux pump family protein